MFGEKDISIPLSASVTAEGNTAILVLLICSKADGLGVSRMSHGMGCGMEWDVEWNGI